MVISIFIAVCAASAQTDGTYVGYSPYSVYGIGNLHAGGPAWSRSMGGIGIATRNKRVVNTANPASVTARDSLSFMSDFSLSGKFSLYKEGDKLGYCPTFNLENFVISFPMWKHTALMVGLAPFSDVGYSISASEVDYYSLQRTFSTAGNGGMNQVFAGAGATLWNRLSLGVEGLFYFGSINKTSATENSDDSFLDFNAGDSLQVHSFGVKFGLQYEQPLSTGKYLTLGGTYRLSTPILGHRISYSEVGSYFREREENAIADDGIRMGDEIGVGLSFRSSDTWTVEIDYTRSSWLNSGFEKVSGFSNNGESANFKSDIGQTFRAGFELTPNRNDIRYFMRRCTYRAGAYFDQSYYTVNDRHVNTVGVTLGMTIPVFRWYNGVTFGLDMGRRGLSGSQLSETFAGFFVSLNMFDIWFQKPRYQ